VRERRLRDLCKQEGRCVARHTQPPSVHSTHSPDAPPAPTFAPHPTPLATGELHALGERVVDAAVDAELAASSHALHAEAPAAGVDAMVHEVRGGRHGARGKGGLLRHDGLGRPSGWEVPEGEEQGSSRKEERRGRGAGEAQEEVRRGKGAGEQQEEGRRGEDLGSSG